MAEEIVNINRLLLASSKTPGLITLEATVMHGFEPQAWDECVEKCQPVEVVLGNGRIFFNILARNFEKSLRLLAIDNLFLVCHTFRKYKSSRNAAADMTMFRVLAENILWSKYIEQWIELDESVGLRNLKKKSCRPSTRSVKEQGKSSAEPLKKQTEINGNGHHTQPSNSLQTEENRVIRKLDLLFQEALTRLNRHTRPVDPAQLKETARRKIVAELESLACSLNCPLTKHELSVVSSLLDNIVSSRYEIMLNDTDDRQPFGRNFGLHYLPQNKSDVEIYTELDDLVSKTMNSVFSAELSEEETASNYHVPPLSPNSYGVQSSSPAPLSPSLFSPPSTSCDSYEESVAVNCTAIEKIPQTRKTSKEIGSLKFKVTLCSNDRLACSFPDAASAIGEVLTEQFGWELDSANFDLNIFFVFEHGTGFTTLSLTKPRRTVVDYGMNTLSAALCYNLIRLADPKPGDIILDPMCGSCSISIEGTWAFSSTFHIAGDLNERALLRTKNNIHHVAKKFERAKIDAFRWNVKQGLPFRDGTIDIIVTDLPTGLGNKNNVPLYTATLKELAKVTRKGTGRAVFFTSDWPAFTKALNANQHLWAERDKFEVFQKNYFADVCLLQRKR